MLDMWMEQGGKGQPTDGMKKAAEITGAEAQRRRAGPPQAFERPKGLQAPIQFPNWLWASGNHTHNIKPVFWGQCGNINNNYSNYPPRCVHFKPCNCPGPDQINRKCVCVCVCDCVCEIVCVFKKKCLPARSLFSETYPPGSTDRLSKDWNKDGVQIWAQGATGNANRRSKQDIRGVLTPETE